MTTGPPDPWVRGLVALGALNGLLAVGLGAAGTHALASRFVTGGDQWFATAGHYQGLHALALFVAAWLCDRLTRPGLARGAGVCFAAGIVLFSGALYWRAIGGTGWFAHAAPFGGSLLLMGWVALLGAAWR